MLKQLRKRFAGEKNIGYTEVHLRESTFTMEKFEGHHLKQMIKLSDTSKSIARPNVPTNMMQTELNGIIFEIFCRIFNLNLIELLEALLLVYEKYIRFLKLNNTKKKQSDKFKVQGHYAGHQSQTLKKSKYHKKIYKMREGILS